MTKNILILAGDGIGPEIMVQTQAVLAAVNEKYQLNLVFDEALVGGCAIDATGHPLPPETLTKARSCDAILLAAVGGPKWDKLEMALRPERGLLGIRSDLGLFANLRPAILYPQLVDSSTLKPEVVSGLDIMIVRELTGGIYFGQPRGVFVNDKGEREGFNTARYTESEIRRIGKVAFDLAMQIFHMTKTFPREEVYSLTDQVRRSSRSVCANLAEGYRKRIYPKHFISKLSDSDAELSETLIWLDFAVACGYAEKQTCEILSEKYEAVGRMIGKMMAEPERFLPGAGRR